VTEQVSAKGAVVKAAGIVLAMSILGRLAGFVREQVIAAHFGTSAMTDSYVMAFAIPNVIYVIIGGALSTAFIPVFSQYLVGRDENRGWRVTSTIINLAVLIMSAIAVLGIVLAPYLVRLFAPGFDAAQAALTAKLTRIMFPLIVFSVLTMLIQGILNSYRRFAAPALTSVAFSVTVIVSVLALAPTMGVTGLAVGTLAAAAAQILIQLPSLWKHLGRYRPCLDLRDPGVLQIWTLVLPSMGGTAITQAYTVVDRMIASGLPAGSIAALNFANKLMFLPFNLFVLAINTAIFPVLSTQASRGDLEEVSRTTHFGLRLTALFIVPCAVGLLVLAEPIVRLVFERGAFDATSTEMTAFALGFYSLGLFFQGGYNILNRTFYSIKDTKTPLKISAAVVLLNIILALLLVRPLQHGGLALANSLAALCSFWISWAMLKKRLPKTKGESFLRSIRGVLIAAAIMGAALVGLTGLMRSLPVPGGPLVQVSIMLAVGVMVYGVFVVVFRVEEVKWVMEKIAVWRRRPR
jgi:putative peptidoglycan lipid II flippase